MGNHRRMRLRSNVNVNRISLTTLLILAIITLSACVGSGQLPEEHFYRLPELQPTITFSQPLSAGSLDIPRLRATGMLHERALLFSKATAPTDMQVYHYHQWQDPPSVLVRDHLIDYLRRSNVADRILPPTTGIETELRLVGKLTRFERVVGTSQATATVEAEFTLLRGRKVVFGPRPYRAQSATGERSIRGIIAPFGIALQRIYDQLIRDLKATL